MLSAMNADGTAARIARTVAESTPHWPDPPRPPHGGPNILLVLLDDVGFSDFGCYGGDARTPTIDGLAARGLRYTGFHTTAMCSTTRAARPAPWAAPVACIAVLISLSSRGSTAGTLTANATRLHPTAHPNSAPDVSVRDTGTVSAAGRNSAESS